MDVTRVQCLEWGEYKLDHAFLASKILELFEEVEGTLDAYGMGWGCSHIKLIVITRCNFNFTHQG
jgi:hypothetical protein